MKNIFNIVGFQLSWWGCVLGVKSGIVYLGPVLMSIFLILHFYFYTSDYTEIRLIILFGLIGTMIDTSMAYYGIFNYNGTYTPTTFIAPLWITSMWCGFSATVNHSLSWLKNRYFASILLGAVSGPLSYLAGVKFGAIEFSTLPIIAIGVVALFYAVTIPLIYWVNERLIKNNGS
ncbi:MAG: hypothetical protein CMG55_00180 [Candidatus Marinimicrobia bacterium]|nr:hypothetical protein [Candidatus Neomarinimicrobiota bacterium]|tara:strand:- start:22 stop:546 length:525 start_codon:yes stop_codon:yes gene_type:complete